MLVLVFICLFTRWRALRLAVRWLKLRLEVQCVASPEFPIWGVCCSMYILLDETRRIKLRPLDRPEVEIALARP